MPQRHLVQLLSKLLWPADRSSIANNTDVIISDSWVNNFKRPIGNINLVLKKINRHKISTVASCTYMADFSNEIQSNMRRAAYETFMQVLVFK